MEERRHRGRHRVGGRHSSRYRQLGAFINQLEAQSGKKVDEVDAVLIIEEVDTIVAELTAP